MWPVLAASYFLLAKEEEDELRKKFPEEFREYSKETPMFI
jgi:protein-S-isoprenylcysteine O-methyltransferase Ste14